MSLQFGDEMWSDMMKKEHTTEALHKTHSSRSLYLDL